MEGTTLNGRGVGRSREWKGFAFCLAAAAAMLMICSMNSFLYPLNRWEDVNCFVTVARGVLKGLMPYRDLAEQKGPLLYALHVLALWPNPNSYHGIYFVELAAMAPFLYLCWRTLRLYDDRLSVAWMAPLMAFLCVQNCFRLGDSAEELCLPFVMATIFAALRAFRRGEPISLRGYVGHGALAGCVFWIKYSQLGPHFMFMAMTAILAVVDDSRAARAPRLGRAVKMCLAFLAGMALATLPWFAWFGLAGALGDMLRMYIHDNVFGYVYRRFPVIVQMGIGMVRGMLGNWPMAAAMIAGLACVLAAPTRAVSRRAKWFLVLTAASTVLFVYGGGRRYAYYFFAFAPFAAFALLAVAPIRRRLARGRRRASRALAAALCAIALVVSAGGAYLGCGISKYIGLPWEKTPQGVIGGYIRDHEDRTLLNLHSLDAGFYTAADVLPVNRCFCMLNSNSDRCMAEQLEIVADQGVHFLVMGKGETMEGMLEAVREEFPGLIGDDFAPKYHLALEAYGYNLYERDAL